jgi:hypothetical protein
LSRYAENTSVPVDRSQAEIMRNLRRYGAKDWAFGEENGSGVVRFRFHQRPIQFRLDLPDFNAEQFRLGGWKKPRSPEAHQKAWEQACRQRWRALNLFILSSLEAVAAGILPEDEAFIANTLLANSETLGEYMAPTIRKALETGGLPRLLLPGPIGTGNHKEKERTV